MSQAERIIEQVDSGVPYQQVASANPWQDIGPADRHRLFSEAESRSTSDEKPVDLLRAVYSMAENAGDNWDLARVLALVLRRPDIPLAMKQGSLRRLRKTLDQLRSTLGPQDAASAKRYKLCEADYYALKAEVTQEEGQLDQALAAYREAHAIWEKYGVKDKAKLADEQMTLLEGIAQSQQSLLPLAMLTGERTRLQEENVKLQADIRSATKDLSALTERAQRLETDKSRVESETQALLGHLEELRSDEEKRHSRLRDLSGEISQSEAALRFLFALPRAATAPLWLEVLKLALAQGNMDPLALQAMERLSIQCPEEGLPVLAEIIARLPDGHGVDPTVFQRVSTDWVVGMSRAMTRAKGDPEGAARELIEAWSGLFGEGKQEAESAG